MYGHSFPWGVVLVAAAIYAGTTHQLAVAPIILAATMGAILGNLLGFFLGSRGGSRVLVRYGRFLLFTVVGGVFWSTVIGLGAYYLGDSFHRPTGPPGIALTVLVLCLFLSCLMLLLRHMRQFEDEAERRTTIKM